MTLKEIVAHVVDLERHLRLSQDIDATTLPAVVQQVEATSGDSRVPLDQITPKQRAVLVKEILPGLEAVYLTLASEKPDEQDSAKVLGEFGHCGRVAV
ncbi:hypothetical protein [Azotobacter salinestris]|uniref:hypothetical protein n=1 Tax=Azotobacter salinestris TaxID=69964 RepID=UPI0032DEE995